MDFYRRHFPRPPYSCASTINVSTIRERYRKEAEQLPTQLTQLCCKAIFSLVHEDVSAYEALLAALALKPVALSLKAVTSASVKQAPCGRGVSRNCSFYSLI
jgi:hypothetical protein